MHLIRNLNFLKGNHSLAKSAKTRVGCKGIMTTKPVEEWGYGLYILAKKVFTKNFSSYLVAQFLTYRFKVVAYKDISKKSILSGT